ncbi:MAG TPA: peptidylprolyl isomerase [Bacilli bacterium]
MSRNKLDKHRSNSWRIVGLLAMAALLVLSLAACGKKPVAVYKGGEISAKDFDTFLAVNKLIDPYYSYYETMPDFKRQMVEQLVVTRYLTKDATADQVKQAESKSDEDWKNFQGYIKSGENEQQYKDALKELKLSEDDLREFLEEQALFNIVLEDKFSDEELQKRFDEDVKKDPNVFTTATVDHILIALKDQEGKDLRTPDEALKRAQEVREKLLNGGDFAALAKEYSDDPGSKDNGGQYKDAEVNLWVPEFKQAALELPLNQISEPVKTDYGYHVMKVESRHVGELADADVKEKVLGELVGEFLNDFRENELPKILTKVNLPKESPTQAPQQQEPLTSPAPSAAPDAQSPAPAETQSPAPTATQSPTPATNSPIGQ